jgi:hypothetical protein
MTKLWDGYSLLMMQGNDHGYHQDLGSAGSCLQKFSALPYLRCDHTNVCYYGQTNDLTYYLSTTEPMPMMPVQRDQIRPYISRCAVCEAPANVMSFHSLSMTPPPCPNGWNILWQGYSFVMVRLKDIPSYIRILNNRAYCVPRKCSVYLNDIIISIFFFFSLSRSILVVVLKAVVNHYQVLVHVLKIFVQHHLLNVQEQMVIVCIMQINSATG